MAAAATYTPHPVFAAIGDGDSELQLVLAGLPKPVYPLSEIISGGPHGRTNTYKNMELGLPPTFVSRGRRYAFKLNYGKYLLSLARIGEMEGRRCRKFSQSSALSGRELSSALAEAS